MKQDPIFKTKPLTFYYTKPLGYLSRWSYTRVLRSILTNPCININNNNNKKKTYTHK